MWIATNFGFFSVVQKDGDDFLTVRARVRADLVNLRLSCPGLSVIEATPGNDYPFRATVSHYDWSVALGHVAMDIDYSNFKDEVGERQGHARASVYARVWSALLGLEVVTKRKRKPQPIQNDYSHLRRAEPRYPDDVPF